MKTSLVCHVVLQLSILATCRGRDEEKMQRTLAAANMKRFPESLLHEALFPDHDPSKPITREELKAALESEAGQEAARGAALHAMLDASPSRGMERSHEVGWLGSMCDSIPWLSYLVTCEEHISSEQRESGDLTLALQHFEYATCPM